MKRCTKVTPGPSSSPCRVSPHPGHVLCLQTDVDGKAGVPIPAPSQPVSGPLLCEGLPLAVFGFLVCFFFNRTIFFSNEFQPLLGSFPCP